MTGIHLRVRYTDSAYGEKAFKVAKCPRKNLDLYARWEVKWLPWLKCECKEKIPLPFMLGVSRLGGRCAIWKNDYEVKFDRRNLLSLESEVKDRADIDKPSFGIISTGWSLSFKDIHSRIFWTMQTQGFLWGIGNKDFLEGTIKKTKKSKSVILLYRWDYDNDNPLPNLVFSFKDKLENLAR